MSREELTQAVGDSFRALLHDYDICMLRTLSKYGLYPGQPELLFSIRSLGSPTQHELAVEMGLSKASVGVSVRRLEKSGFVKRLRDKKDTRCIRIALTQKGIEYARWCDIDFEVIFTTMIESFSGDERERVLDTIRRMDLSLTAYKKRLEDS